MNNKKKLFLFRTISDLSWQIAKQRGYYEADHSFFELAMLLHSEISEMMEAHRKGVRCFYDMERLVNNLDDEEFIKVYKDDAKGSIEEESADLMIRLINFCKFMEIDLEGHVMAKLRYVSLTKKDESKKY